MITKLQKLTPEEEAALDPTQIGKLAKVEADVEAQELYVGIYECGWCGQKTRMIMDTEHPCRVFACGWCGRHLRAD